VSVPIFVLGLERISEMHETDLELALKLLSLENAVTISLLLCLNCKRKKACSPEWILGQVSREEVCLLTLAPGPGSGADLCHL